MWRILLLTCCLALVASAAACNLIDARLGRHAELSRMVPGAPETQPDELGCWLTVEFMHYPPNVDPRDVQVRFQSMALAEPAVFDWHYIAEHDHLTRRDGYGSGLHEAEVTHPGTRPPLGQPTQVRFPLRFKRVIENAPAVLYLEAELYWGGQKQHAMRQTIEHVYQTDPVVSQN